MSTRSVIAKLNPNGSVMSVYCHYDGYPSWVGKTLLNNYTDATKIDELLALGDLSGLEDCISKSRAYHRDYGEDIEHSYSANSLEEFVKGLAKDGWDIEYVYLFKDGKWFYHATYKDVEFVELTNEICEAD